LTWVTSVTVSYVKIQMSIITNVQNKTATDIRKPNKLISMIVL